MKFKIPAYNSIVLWAGILNFKCRIVHAIRTMDLRPHKAFVMFHNFEQLRPYVCSSVGMSIVIVIVRNEGLHKIIFR